MFKIHRNLLSVTELEELRNWLYERRSQAVPGLWQGNGTKGGTYRLTIYENEIPSGEKYIVDRPEWLLKIKEQAKELTGAKKYYNPVCVANVEFIGSYGYVPDHIDDNFGHTDCDHMRFNLLITKPEIGGMPVIEGEVLELEAGDCWSFLANKHRHSCQTVEGNVERVSASIGLLC